MAVCEFAEAVEAWFAAADWQSILASSRAKEETCPGPQPRGLGDAFPLCEGSAAGEVRAGYFIARLGSEGGVLSRGQLTDLLRLWSDQTRPGLNDAHGTGALRLATVGCQLNHAGMPDCTERFTLVFTSIQEMPNADRPFRLLMGFTGDIGASGPVIRGLIAGLGEGAGRAAPLRDGGLLTTTESGSGTPITYREMFHPWLPSAEGR
jgi:hypothetical protein